MSLNSQINVSRLRRNNSFFGTHFFISDILILAKENGKRGINMKEFKLSNGLIFPAVGYGTYLATKEKGTEAIAQAIEVGYRYFDTASFYMNEEQVGEAIKESRIERDEIQICSKLWRTQMEYENALKAFDESINKLKTDYLDLYLIHWPKNEGAGDEWKDILRDTWRAMEELYKSGRAKAIGLSNFLPHHIDAIWHDADIKPMVDQLELHVGYMQLNAVEYAKEKGMLIQAWSPLGRRRVIDEPIVLKMAEKYKTTPAGFLLSFLNKQQIMVIPKASAKERMIKNLNIEEIDIEDEDMKYLLNLPQIGWSGEHPDLV